MQGAWPHELTPKQPTRPPPRFDVPLGSPEVLKAIAGNSAGSSSQRERQTVDPKRGEPLKTSKIVKELPSAKTSFPWTEKLKPEHKFQLRIMPWNHDFHKERKENRIAEACLKASRAIMYGLRHDTNLKCEKGGWHSFESLQEYLSKRYPNLEMSALNILRHASEKPRYHIVTEDKVLLENQCLDVNDPPGAVKIHWIRTIQGHSKVRMPANDFARIRVSPLLNPQHKIKFRHGYHCTAEGSY